MSNINSFYYDLLHIAKSNQLDQIKDVVKKTMTEVSKYSKESDGLCKVYSHNISEILNSEDISNMIVNLNEVSDSVYDHEFIIASYKDEEMLKYLLIDPTYQQFTKQEGKVLRNTFLEWPGEVLKGSPIGKEIFSSLSTNGLTEMDDKRFNIYIDSFGYSAKTTLDNLFIDKIKNK